MPSPRATDPAAGSVEIRDLGWTPLGRATPVLAGLRLTIDPGERVLLVGPSGSGKSTLLRAIAGVLGEVEPGRLSGDVHIGGTPARGGDGRVGLLVQDPGAARVADTVGRDVAFGPENLGVPREQIWQRVETALAEVGFPYGVDHLTGALSGGEAQRLALAGVLALRPSVLLLDEPTSMLDAASAATVRESVRRAVAPDGAGAGRTLVVVEHRLEGWAELVDRLIVLGPPARGSAEGAGESVGAAGDEAVGGGACVVLADGPVRRVLAEQRDALLAAGIWVPGAPDPVPAAIPAGLVPAYPAAANPPTGRTGGATLAATRAGARSGEPLLRAHGLGLTRTPRLGFGLGRRRPRPTRALVDGGLEGDAGGVHALCGPSGAGKSSLLGVLTGLERPSAGEVLAGPGYAGAAGPAPHRWSSPQLAARVGWVPQNAELSVVGGTVLASMLATVRALHRDEATALRRARDLLAVLGLAGLERRNPHQLSGGELRRLAVATALVHGPALLALDEPTVGQDRHTWAAVTGLMTAAADAGAAVVVSTHDERLLRYADRVTSLDHGRIVADTTGPMIGPMTGPAIGPAIGPAHRAAS